MSGKGEGEKGGKGARDGKKRKRVVHSYFSPRIDSDIPGTAADVDPMLAVVVVDEERLRIV